MYRAVRPRQLRDRPADARLRPPNEADRVAGFIGRLTGNRSSTGENVMGWTHLYKSPDESAKDFLARHCVRWSTLSEQAHPRVVASATGPRGCIALAVRFPAQFFIEQKCAPFDDYQAALDGSITLAMVFLTSGGEGSGSRYNFGYKDMSESMGPCEPVAASILAHLSPLARPDSYAHNWRERCQVYSASKSAGRTIKDGTRIKFAEPFKSTSGATVQEFEAATILRKGRQTRVWRALPSGGLWRFTSEQVQRAQIAA